MNNKAPFDNDGAVAAPPSPDIVAALLQRKWFFLIAIFIGTSAAAISAAYMDRAWRSEVLLVIAKSDEESGSMSGLSGAMGGISALAGISMPTDAARTEYMATLKSNGLARNFFHQGTVALDFCNGKILKCPDPASWHKLPPEEFFYRMVRKFQRSVLDVEEDKITGLIRVSVTWVDPNIAAEWANGIVAEANTELQRRAVDESNRRLNYLRDEVQKTDLVPLRDAISRLMEGQVKTAMMAQTRPEYAFRVIDPARPSARYDYVKPRRAVMMAGGAALGFLLVAVWTVLQPPRIRRN
jgi:uncharacterized protein involved in exopolysaccharide biosynthesis